MKSVWNRFWLRLTHHCPVRYQLNAEVSAIATHTKRIEKNVADLLERVKKLEGDKG